ncbi:hypothetical protein [Zooshikella ganghwensis]|nr:hypothetical protein [Zooshikella ganghwensis]
MKKNIEVSGKTLNIGKDSYPWFQVITAIPNWRVNRLAALKTFHSVI